MSGLEVPWSLVFTSPTRMLVTERPGPGPRRRERRARARSRSRSSPDVEATGRERPDGHGAGAGLRDVPARLPGLRLRRVATGSRVRVVRYRDDGDSLSGRTVIIEGIPAARNHAGCRIRFGPGRQALRDDRGRDGPQDRPGPEVARRQDPAARTRTARFRPTTRFRARPCLLARPPQRPGHRLGSAVGAPVPDGARPVGLRRPGRRRRGQLVEKGKNYGWPVVHHKRVRRREWSRRFSSTRRRSRRPARRSRPATLCRPSRATSSSRICAARVLIRVRLDPKDPRRVLETEELFRDVYGRLRDVVVGAGRRALRRDQQPRRARAAPAGRRPHSPGCRSPLPSCIRFDSRCSDGTGGGCRTARPSTAALPRACAGRRDAGRVPGAGLGPGRRPHLRRVRRGAGRPARARATAPLLLRYRARFLDSMVRGTELAAWVRDHGRRTAREVAAHRPELARRRRAALRPPGQPALARRRRAGSRAAPPDLGADHAVPREAVRRDARARAASLERAPRVCPTAARSRRTSGWAASSGSATSLLEIVGGSRACVLPSRRRRDDRALAGNPLRDRPRTRRQDRRHARALAGNRLRVGDPVALVD